MEMTLFLLAFAMAFPAGAAAVHLLAGSEREAPPHDRFGGRRAKSAHRPARGCALDRQFSPVRDLADPASAPATSGLRRADAPPPAGAKGSLR
jgi:hypothetical protein